MRGTIMLTDYENKLLKKFPNKKKDNLKKGMNIKNIKYLLRKFMEVK